VAKNQTPDIPIELYRVTVLYFTYRYRGLNIRRWL
jgi:hypothetical protein